MRLRATPEDFRVDEVPLYPPRGEGEHTFVRIEKRLRTTEELARDLARAAGVRARDVGYAGRKDRRAVTTQWLSVPGLEPDRALDLALPGARVLEAVRHPHKLRTGQLAANRFEIVVRDVPPGVREGLDARLARIERTGFANRFGAQRFGRDGDNALRARALLRGASSRGARRDARFLLSALQSLVFNAALAARPVALDALEPGDVALRHDSGGLFVVEDVAAEAARAAAFEISATGPIFGTRPFAPGGVVATRERALLALCGIDPERLRPPPGVRLRGARRSVRARPEGTRLESADADVRLCFTLRSGSYATVLLEELLGPFEVAANDRTRERGVCSGSITGSP